MEGENHMWNQLNIDYENAYQDNPFKKSCVNKAISLLRPGARVLDVGCGTGVPVAQMLAHAEFEVEGIDVAPNMVELAKSRIRGTFSVVDMVSYEPSGPYEGVFIIYSQLGLSYSSFDAVAKRLARFLVPGGIMVIGQSPADGTVPEDAPEWDQTKTWVSGFNLPFMGEPFATLMFTREGQRRYLESMGLEIVYETVDVFQPKSAKAHAETQQYIIGRRPMEH